MCYISEDHWRRHGRREDINVTLCMPGDRVFGIPRYAETIEVRQEEVLLVWKDTAPGCTVAAAKKLPESPDKPPHGHRRRAAIACLPACVYNTHLQCV